LAAHLSLWVDPASGAFLSDSVSSVLHNKNMNLNLFDDGRKLRTHILKVLSLSFFLSGMLAVSLDQALSILFARPSLETLWLYARNITNIGLSEYYFLAAILTYLFFRWVAPKLAYWKEREVRRSFLQRWGLNFFCALLGSGIALLIIKFVVGRQRPHKSAPFFYTLVFHPFSIHWHWQSFPSGHSQVMFAVATMMSIAWPRFRWLWITFASIICFTRVIVHDHFLSDTVFGAALGYCMTLWVLFLMRKYTKQGL
jgi:membrane-associated phospholipid phosphatase